MDRSALARKRRQDAPQPATAPTTQVLRNKRAAQNVQGQDQSKPDVQQAHGKISQSHNAIAGAQQARPPSGKIRSAKDSSEIIRAKRGDALGDVGDEDPFAKHFTVGNVGAGGTLFLKPSRLPAPRYARPPATPPDTSDGGANSTRTSTRTVWPTGRTSDMTLAGWTARTKSAAYDHTVPVPPISLNNAHPKRRPRSHSFSTISERDRINLPALDSTEIQDFQFLLNGRESHHPRPKSSLDLGDGYLHLHIPHYRLGTPRFSDRGTAYLHNSIYTNTTEDMNSSVFSRAEFDKLFPAPPGRNGDGTRRSLLSRAPSSPQLHTPHAYQGTPARTPPTPPLSNASNRGISPAIFDKIEANPNDPSIVRYSPETGRIVAATSARLVAQITSPRFLDYELLSDFFLTFRDFLSCGELLEYLLARMRWALGNKSDAGRIVRVRAFVSLRHWILNYFSDDFLLDYNLRQRFCDVTNNMCIELRQRSNNGGGDLNILGELKKCWRRTCALFWNTADAMNVSPDVDIEPGGEPEENAYATSSISLPLVLQQNRLGDSNQATLAPQVSSQAASQAGRKSPLAQHVMTNPPETPKSRARKTSMPTSPMSEDSMHVLSCSVPFLRNVCATGTKHESRAVPPRPVGAARHPPVSMDQARPTHQHKRSGSFSDALRDERTPLPSTKVDGTDGDPSDVTFTGGLVRGLVLQPCPANIDVPIILTPSEHPARPRIAPMDEQIMDDKSAQHLGVKRIVGDMRRALSNRKAPGDSPSPSHRSGSSPVSKVSNRLVGEPKPEQLTIAKTVWQQPQSTSRVDLLNATIEDSYKDAYRDVVAQNTADEAKRLNGGSRNDSAKAESVVDSKRPYLNRSTSQVTTSSQSIMIVDATGPPELPPISRALPSVSSWSSNMTPAPLFRNPNECPLGDIQDQDYFTSAHGAHYAKGLGALHHEQRAHSASPHASYGFADDWRMTASSAPNRLDLPPGHNQARASSGVQTPGLDFPIHQLRRRPGGDLKAADNVRELESEPRPQSAGTMSTISRSATLSGPTSRELSGTHFSGHNTVSQLQGLRSPTRTKSSFHLIETPSQPYMRKSLGEDATRLATLPDESPGGIEDALLKLEGRNGGRRASTTAMFSASRDSIGDSLADRRSKTTPEIRRLSRTESDFSGAVGESSRTPTTDRQGASIYHLSASDAFTDNNRYSRSEFTDERSVAPVLAKQSNTTRFPIQETESNRSSPRNVAFAEVPAKVGLAGNPGAPQEDNSEPKSAASQGSFLLDDDESLSEISTELGDQTEDVNFGVRSFFFDDTVEEESIALQMFRHPPTPPSTVGAPPNSSPERHMAKPKTPSNSHRPLKEAASAPKILSNQLPKSIPPPSTTQAPLRRVCTSPERDDPSHLPFILSVDSAVVAEQLTIIEKDALDEIDWKDLIGLNWQQNPAPVRNWVAYLQTTATTSANGIDLVIARFNLVVKWVTSECILTSSPAERARTLAKFIHIADHCLRLRNYASTFQITQALLSADLQRLRRTWTLVATPDRATLARLEVLCQPVRNFAALRADMETAAFERGCIPFLGLYTHDLAFNAQKPSHIDPAPPGSKGRPKDATAGCAASKEAAAVAGKEVLVNFERYQTAAGVAKGLLRLLEASGRFVLRPQPQCLSRCLWLAALGDEEIAARSRGLE